MMTYGKQLRYWLEARNVSVSLLAQMIKRNRSAVHNLLNDETTPQRTTHTRICRALGIDEDNFFVQGGSYTFHSGKCRDQFPAGRDQTADSPSGDG